MKKPAFGTDEYRQWYWSQVDQSGGKWGCWPWLLSTQKTRRRAYGNCWRDGRYDKAHRVMWELVNFPIPDGYVVMHLCDNAWCVNPNHLVVGTQEANTFDAKRKGRLRGRSRAAVSSIPPAQSYLIAAELSATKDPDQ